MNLIDADKLIEDIEKLNLELFEEFKYADSGGMKITSNAQMYIICESVLPRIKEQPTAFDVDKVVSELEDYKMWKELLIYDLDFRERQIIKRALEIVKRGGIND